MKIPLEPSSPINVAGDLTVEFWLRAEAGANQSGSCRSSEDQGDTWINGNIVVDRDVFFDGDNGDYGIALYGGDGGRLAFGVARGDQGRTLCGGDNLADGAWHHVAATRREAGPMRLFVDGRLVAEGDGPAGDISYRSGRDTDYPNSDPFLVLAAEKHDAGSDYPSFSGWLDELRISSVVRYDADFAAPTEPFVADPDTVGLFHMDEGAGEVLVDSSGAPGGPSNGIIRFGGDAGGPLWEQGAPLGASPVDTTTPDGPTTSGPATTGATTSEAPASTTVPDGAVTTTAPSTAPPAPTTSTDDGDDGGSTSTIVIAAGVAGAVAVAATAVTLVVRRRQST